MSKSARVLFLVIALVVAAMVSYIVYQKTAKQTAVTAEGTADQKVIQIVVVERELGRGAVIAEPDVRMATYLEKTAPTGHFTDLTKAVGRVVVQPLKVTEPVLESALAPTDLKKGGMAAVIAPQKRAMAVKVDDVIGVAGFLLPDHYVDVLVALEQPGEKREQISKTVLENIKVLSVGTQTQDANDKEAKKVTVATLEVTLEEGEKLALAVNQGRIQLALRGYPDTDQILTKGITVPTLLKSYATASDEPVKVSAVAAQPAAPVKPRKVTRQRVIEVMNGNKVNRISMDSY